MLIPTLIHHIDLGIILSSPDLHADQPLHAREVINMDKENCSINCIWSNLMLGLTREHGIIHNLFIYYQQHSLRDAQCGREGC